MASPVIAVLGAGNMGSSLIGGLIKNGHSANQLWAADPSQEKLDYLSQAFGIRTTTDNAVAMRAANVVILAVKPQVLAHVASDLQEPSSTHSHLFISIVAGIRIRDMQGWLGHKAAIVRTMPNTPALIGCGATALFANEQVSAEQRSLAESIMRAVGITVWLDNESLIDAVTALSGSGPAYFFHMMEGLQLAAEEFGLPSETAKLLTLQTALGAARMAMESGESLEVLRQRVTSPGGTTERAVSVLEENKIHQLYKKAMQAAKLRSEELAHQLGENK